VFEARVINLCDRDIATLPISPHDRMSKSAESLPCRVHNLHIEIMKNKFKQVMNNTNFELIYLSIMMHLMLEIIS